MRPIVVMLAAAVFAAAQQPPADRTTLIRNATIIDGTGSPRRTGDLRIAGDRISEIGQLTPTAQDVVVDARGLALAPGFIDTHSHHDGGLSDQRDALAMVTQGVTTIVVGQDGSGSNLAALFARLDAQPAAVNVASYAGHGSIRRTVLGSDFARLATADEIEHMKSLLRAEMEAGALGFSTGLEYDPGIYSAPDEVVALATVAAESGGRYISHIRSEDRELWKAIDEVIAIGRTTGMPVQVSHVKLGMSDLWGQAARLIGVLDAARASGVQITADIYPYTYWQSNLGVFYPKRNFADAGETNFILSHLTPAEEIIFSTGLPGHPEYAGKTLAQIAAMRGTPNAKTMMDLLAEPGGPRAGVVAKGMIDADVEALIRWPFANVCSDGQSSGRHPRGFGSFAKVLGPYVRDRKLFALEEAVRKMSNLSARNVGITNRGLLAPGYFADLVLFDMKSIADRSTFELPQAQAVGVRSVWVNGQVVFDAGATTGRYPGRALRRETRSSARESESCDALARLSLPNARITAAQAIDRGSFTLPSSPDSDAFRRLPPFCRVAATLAPTSDSDIKIEVWMPASGWNGKFMAVGNGAFNGAIAYPAMAAALTRGYATSSTDTGHSGNTASFALGHPEKAIDFGWRAVHGMTTAAKTIVAARYAAAPTHSYWNGCSAGGRQAMKAAQRFPADFDGIIAGAPGLDWTGRAAQAVRLAQALERTQSARLTRAGRELLHRAVVEACDALDGVRDGLIENPKACRFDPDVLLCRDSATSTGCLSAPQIETVRMMYSSPPNPATGRPITGQQPGSELGWTDLGWTASARATGLDQFRFLVARDPSWDLPKFDFAADIARAEAGDDDTINALDPNLKPFIDRGGKLIQYHGWSDPQISPGNSTQYYERVVERLGGTANVDASYRLFMAPGMGHCGGGEGPNTFDMVAALEQWVEHGQAPDRIIATHSTNGVVDRTRPLCPYPQVAVYTGTGSTDDAASFACRTR